MADKKVYPVCNPETLVDCFDMHMHEVRRVQSQDFSSQNGTTSGNITIRSTLVTTKTYRKIDDWNLLPPLGYSSSTSACGPTAQNAAMPEEDDEFLESDEDEDTESTEEAQETEE